MLLCRSQGVHGGGVGCGLLVRSGVFKLTCLVNLFPHVVHLASHLAHVASQLIQDLVEQLALVLIRVGAPLVGYHRQLCAFRVFGYELVNGAGVDFALCAQHRHLLCYVLKLAHVSRPLIFEHNLLGIFRERYARDVIFFCHLHGEQLEQKQNVVAAFAQRRHLYRYGVKAVIEVFAESPLAHRFLHVHVGCCHNAHVGLAYLLSTHADIFACLKHAQQTGLCGERQLSHLVEEYCSFVGCAKIAIALANGSCERTLLVSEQFAVYRSLRNGAAVDGKIFLSASW